MSPTVARTAARHRSLLVFLILALTLLGIFALGRLPVDSAPTAEDWRLEIRYSVPGLAAPLVAQAVTRHVEKALVDVPGVKAMDSETYTGGVRIRLWLSAVRNLSAVRREIAQRLDQARPTLLASLDSPTVTRIDDSTGSIVFQLVSPSHDALTLADWTESGFAKPLRDLPGVAAVEVSGGPDREIVVWPDQRRLAGYGLSFEDVLRTIRQNPEASLTLPPPAVKSRSRRDPVQSRDLAAVAALPMTLPDGESIALSEVARLTLQQGPKPHTVEAGTVADVRVTVYKQDAAALSDVVERVRAHVDWMRANRLLPETVRVQAETKILDAARDSLQRVAMTTLAGFLLLMVATHLLWGSARRTLILGICLLATFQACFGMMAIVGLSLDVQTLSALALGMGLFGGTVLWALELGTDRGPIPEHTVNPVHSLTAFMLTVLLALILVGGEPGVLYRNFLIVFAVAWLFNAWLALWLVRLFDGHRRLSPTERNVAVLGYLVLLLRRIYDRSLRRWLRQPGRVLVLAVGLFSVVIGAMIVAFPEKSRSIVLDQELVLHVVGPDHEMRAVLANELARKLGQDSNWRGIDVRGAGRHVVPLPRLDEERARDLGVDLAMIGRALAIAQEGIEAGQVRDADRRYALRVRLSPEDSGGVASGKILLLGELEGRPAVHVRDIVTLERVELPERIYHQHGQPVTPIVLSLSEDVSPGAALKKIKESLSQTVLPEGYYVSLSRPADQRSLQDELVLFGSTAALIFLVALGLRRVIRIAILVLVTAGTALIGLVAGVWLMGLPSWSSGMLAVFVIFGLSAGHTFLLVTWADSQSPNMRLLRSVRHIARLQFRPFIGLVLFGFLSLLAVSGLHGGTFALGNFVVFLSLGLVVLFPTNLIFAPLLYSMLIRKEQNTEVLRHTGM